LRLAAPPAANTLADFLRQPETQVEQIGRRAAEGSVEQVRRECLDRTVVDEGAAAARDEAGNLRQTVLFKSEICSELAE